MFNDSAVSIFVNLTLPRNLKLISVVYLLYILQMYIFTYRNKASRIVV